MCCQTVLRVLRRGSIRVAQGSLFVPCAQKNTGFACFFAVSRETLGILRDTRRCVAEKIVFCRPKGFFTQSVRKNRLRKVFAQFVHSSCRRAIFRQASCFVSPTECFAKYACKMLVRHVHAGVFMMNLRKILKKIIC